MVPVQRKTRTQTRKGRSHDAMRPPHIVACPNCGAHKRPHTACAECGYVRRGLSLKSNEED